MTRIELENEIKQLIIASLDLEDVEPSDIDSAAPLFIEGLGLDSIDALELGMALKKKYDISFKTNDQENKKHFMSVNTLVDFIVANKNIELEQ
jgi:acyl carrier protein